MQINTMYCGDNLHILRSFDDACIDLIYLDPPFCTQRDFGTFKDAWTLDDIDEAWLGQIAEQNEGVYKVCDAAGITHSKGMKSYLCFMAVRLMELHRVLKDTGSLYLHVDPTASHYLKMMMDSIFGRDNFRNEVIWHYGLGGSSPRCYSKKHDVLLFYSKGDKWYFDKPQEPATSAMLNGKMKGVKDVWDIPSLNNMAKERCGYPTQKPLALLERIISASSNVGDVVLDPFCGCATTCDAAERLGRQWVGIDLNQEAIDIGQRRLSGVPKKVSG